MRNLDQRHIEQVPEVNNSEYLRGYRDGIKDRRASSRPPSADGLLGALLAIALLVGIGYCGYNYATTGQILPMEVELYNPFSRPNTPET